jgi:hypothetical protein
MSVFGPPGNARTFFVGIPIELFRSPGGRSCDRRFHLTTGVEICESNHMGQFEEPARAAPAL